jgi:hypothetical protein
MMYDDGYNDQGNELAALDRWFNSEEWAGIVASADADCKDSLEVMEHVSDHLGSLTWHMQNDSPKSRVDYEIKMLENYIKQFY